MKCPGCGAAVDEGADLCLECGEPMGDSPAAKVARGEGVAPAPAPVRQIAAPQAPAPMRQIAAPAKKKRWVDDEPEPIRCPGCGIPSRKPRCPGCGVVLRHDE